ncbi:MAG: DUF1697 domain-containing protein [Bradyrhizobiaceae bacterium]|nr:DUF1697 domain-containing protein [Bradyrhizobiaceae bacterium]
MPRYAAFLRGVSPTNATMPALRSSAEAAGFTNVTTVLATGNILFDSSKKSESTLAALLEVHLRETLSRDFPVIVRSVDYLQDMLSSKPYDGFTVHPSDKRVVTFLAKPLTQQLSFPIEQDGARILCVRGTEAFTVYTPSPNGPVFMKLLERTFGKSITTRTWDTVIKVAK